MPEHAIDLEASPEKALAAVGRAAEDWGAEFQGGRLNLPVLAGIRRGLVTGTVEVGPAEGGSRVVFRPETSAYHVQTQAVVILLLAVAGGLLTLVWPFFPKLIAVAPFGAVLALGGWFLVVSRLRTSGPDEFLDAVAVNAEEQGPGGMSPS
ncbi:MAG TPA: hypothetical protein VHC97_06555 [Thermoanaerobaculia bacterium]|nr:hypothetical protein [Thermoanaerobaculia bacterium]